MISLQKCLYVDPSQFPCDYQYIFKLFRIHRFLFVVKFHSLLLFCFKPFYFWNAFLVKSGDFHVASLVVFIAAVQLVQPPGKLCPQAFPFGGVAETPANDRPKVKEANGETEWNKPTKKKRESERHKSHLICHTVCQGVCHPVCHHVCDWISRLNLCTRFVSPPWF